MDFSQSKLTKTEWESIEIPVSQSEKEILKLITNGFNNVHIRTNKTIRTTTTTVYTIYECTSTYCNYSI